MISIIDYGMGNLNSVQKAFELAVFNQNIDEQIIITNDKKILGKSKAIILPGVGAFGEAMKNLEKLDLIDFIKISVCQEKKLFLGICLGFQLLFEKSYELGEFDGLGIIKGEVKKFDELKMKVPHIGWNKVHFENKYFEKSEKFETSIFDGIENDSYFYFVHSYFVELDENFENKNIDIKKFTTEYENKTFLSGINYNKNIFGVQFHPEKSQNNGIKLLENFLKLPIK
ncbi:MAG: imidazole glycerol phosphate synthase subunit HisH [Elusimicrobiota bacterium]|jgi:glutamine amidotransferase|nr:imidazole glycerol phosphate synthase subunit HisH [Elusimicrobiota bacterium]